MTREEIAQWIPHGPSMLLLHQLTHCDPECLVAIGRSPQDAEIPLRDRRDRLPVSAALEYASQAMALHRALSVGSNSPEPRRGFLIRVRQFEWIPSSLDDLSPKIRIEVILEHGSEDVALYRFRLSDQGLDQCRGRLTVHLESKAEAKTAEVLSRRVSGP
jgi:predicted hotdog family 3-hydroxylacyl-ACP dehydratase